MLQLCDASDGGWVMMMMVVCGSEGGREYVIHGEGDIVAQFQRLALMTFTQHRTYTSPRHTLTHTHTPTDSLHTHTFVYSVTCGLLCISLQGRHDIYQ